MKGSQKGFHVVGALIVVFVLAVIGLVGWRVTLMNKHDTAANNDGLPSTTQQSQAAAQDAASYISWEWNGGKWAASQQAPKCSSPVRFSTAPADLTKATSVLYPGQSRGGNYKPHGGLRFDGAKSDEITVKAIMDGYVVSGSRYIESGETQYLFTIVNNCGIAYRYDHLAVLSPAMQAIANTLPAAKENDSRTTNFDKPVMVKVGDTIATSVGFAKTNNVGFDLGVYDYRTPNSAASNSAYLTAHQDDISQAGYAVCWLDMFSASDSARLQNLPAGDQANGKTSDYCK